ncbi:MAG: hypothetical protein PVI26_10835 [Chitinispirillia bacterium]|jgi:hypothetical protein
MKIIFFIKVLIFSTSILSCIYGSEDTDSLPEVLQIAETKPYRFGIHVAGTYHILLNQPKKLWNNYVTGGINFDFPSDLKDLKIKLGIEAGRINNKKSDIDISLLYTSLVFTYKFQVFSSILFIKPHCGFTSTVICLIPNIEIGDLAKEALHPTRQFESEFGILGGIEPVLKIEKILIGIPVYVEVLLSYQEIITVNFALTLGVDF